VTGVPESAAAALAARLGLELAEPVRDEVRALARELAARAPGRVAAVLFYGSGLRDDALEGVLDFYVLTDCAGDWPAPRAVTLAGRLLPPNVGYLEEQVDGAAVRAKFAVMTLAQFGAAMSVRRLDTTLWARFSQPCRCVFVRGPAERERVVEAVCAAVVTASHWAAALGPVQGAPADYWRALYLRTYAAELRVERGDRGADLVTRDQARYAALLPLAWTAAGVAFRATAAGVAPALEESRRASGQRRWALRQRLGRPLNVLRLVKAAFTFDNAMDYVAWKIERHSGYRIDPSPFQRRHPVLAAPGIYLRLRARKVLR
jgi:hypothetical protein